LPFNETLIALITFRLVSQDEGYAGMDNEVGKNFILQEIFSLKFFLDYRTFQWL